MPAKKRVTAPAVVVAPPSPPAVVANASAQLMPSLAQAQDDIVALQAMLASWPTDLPIDLQPVVATLLRTVEGVVLMAQASNAMAQASGLA